MAVVLSFKFKGIGEIKKTEYEQLKTSYQNLSALFKEHVKDLINGNDSKIPRKDRKELVSMGFLGLEHQKQKVVNEALKRIIKGEKPVAGDLQRRVHH